eukprot:g29155.t1
MCEEGLGEASVLFLDRDIPVHNTFIQFDSPSVEDEKTLATAPAWIGPSLQSIVQAEQKKDSVPAETEPSVEGEAMEPISVPTPVTAEAARSLPADLPSVGSAQHFEGLCKRCCFFPKGRCNNGRDCEFCHFEHEKRKRKKKKKDSEEDDSDDGKAELTHVPHVPLEDNEFFRPRNGPGIIGPEAPWAPPQVAGLGPPTHPPSIPPRGFGGPSREIWGSKRNRWSKEGPSIDGRNHEKSERKRGNK